MSEAEIVREDTGEVHALAPSMSGMLPAAAAARMAEVQVSAMFARQCPRSVTRALASIEQACSRPRLAENAEYQYSKGGQEIKGPSIDLLKAIAIEWRNIQYGWEVVTTEGMYSTVRAFAWDVERNVPSSITFRVKHWIDTRGGGRACRDERETYELIANQAARRVRACLENVVPADVVDDAVDWCRKTLAGQSAEPLIDQVKKCVAAFAGIGVTADMIEEKCGRNVDALTQLDVAKMRRVFKSIKDGIGSIEEHFRPAEIKDAGAAAKKPTDLDGMADALAEKATKQKAANPKAGLLDDFPDPDSPEGKKLSAELNR